MSSSAVRVNVVRNYLTSHHMFVDDEWLSGCVEYLTEDSSNNFTEAEIQNLAKEQWLLNDLKDICPGSLPANLKELRKTTLNGRFVLQINAAIDIGTPAYQQYLKLQKVNMENVEATSRFEDKVSSHRAVSLSAKMEAQKEKLAKSVSDHAQCRVPYLSITVCGIRRMIKLYLTDGVQEITAIEYKPMRNLSCDITPGCKALLKGPIECRHGVLLLNESSITLLGGEVQEIALSNSLAGLITTKLSLPMVQETDHNTTLNQPPRNTNLPTPHAQMPSSRPTEDIPTFDPIPEPTRPIARVTSLQVAHNFADDEIDVDQLAAIEAQFSDNYTSNKRPSEEYPLQNNEKKLKMDTRNDPNDYPDDADLFGDEDEDYLREIEAKLDNRPSESKPKAIESKHPIALSSEPYVYIKQINEMSEIDKVGRVFKVKGQIMKLLSKLSVGKDGWSLKCTIVDGTGNLDVDFKSDVLSKLVGFTPEEMTLLKKQMATKPELKEKAVLALTKAKESLQVLYCIIELTILDTPIITKLIPFEHSHLNMLIKRCEASGL